MACFSMVVGILYSLSFDIYLLLCYSVHPVVLHPVSSFNVL